MPDLTTIERTLQTLFTAEAARLARQTGLVHRQSNLTGPLLLLILVGTRGSGLRCPTTGSNWRS